MRAIRVFLAIISFLAVSTLFIHINGLAVSHWAWMARIQFIPALLALNLVAVGLILLATYLLGRIYCSVICPLGIYQDIVSRISSLCRPARKRRLGRFRYTPGHPKLRIGFFIVFGLLFIIGLLTPVSMWIASLIEPYSAFGRMATWLSRPHITDPDSTIAIAAAAVAAVTFVVVTVFAWRTGRGYCNTVCPVGFLLGMESRIAFLRPVIDTDKCNRCGSCARHCKSSCIDSKNHKIDYSRCVACMDCISECSQGAITYARAPKKSPAKKADSATDSSRRAFMLGAVAVGAALAHEASAKKGDGGLTPLRKKEASRPASRLVPAGSISARHLSDHCTACQLCISNCPNDVLHPSARIESFMQPEMSYNDGWCRPECTTCADLCPAGAILPITEAEKSSVKIGQAVVDASLCISASRGDRCGSCAAHCPADAIQLVQTPAGSGRRRPIVNAEACIGCGSCEYHCPVGRVEPLGSSRPAIHVEGINIHHKI